MNKRLRLTFIALGLGLFQGILKMIFSSFPLVEVMAFQTGIIAGFFGAQTTSDIKEAKYANQNNHVDR